MNHHAFILLATCLLAPLTALRADHPTQTAMMEIGNTSLTVVLGAKPSPAEKRVTELLAGRFKDRADIDLAGDGGKAPLRLVIGTTESNKKQGLRRKPQGGRRTRCGRIRHRGGTGEAGALRGRPERQRGGGRCRPLDARDAL